MAHHGFQRDTGYKPTYLKDEAGYVKSTHLLTKVYTEVLPRQLVEIAGWGLWG